MVKSFIRSEKSLSPFLTRKLKMNLEFSVQGPSEDFEADFTMRKILEWSWSHKPPFNTKFEVTKGVESMSATTKYKSMCGEGQRRGAATASYNGHAQPAIAATVSSTPWKSTPSRDTVTSWRPTGTYSRKSKISSIFRYKC